MKGRLFVFYSLLVAVYFLLFVQLFNLQIVHGRQNLSLSEENRIKIKKILALRGIIYDRNNKPLVYNVPKDTSSTGMSGDTPEVSTDFHLRGEGFGGMNALTRNYLYGEVFAHLLGYVNSDNQGVSGLEKEEDQILKGKDGGELMEVDAKGEKIREIGRKEPIAGENLHLAVDLKLQKAAYEALGNKKGAVVISNPQDGEILALVSKPSFDPNLFAGSRSYHCNAAKLTLGADYSKCSRLDAKDISGEVEKLLNNPDRPLFNRATAGVYPPGSVFKIVTAAAGLETGAITKDTMILDSGEIRIGKYRYGSWYFDRFGKTEGLLNVVRAIQRSNDVFFYRVGERTGAKEIVKWAKRFGLAQKVGFMPDPDKERWFLGNTYHLAIGQGKLGTTPLQVNMMTNVIANGGKLCKPQLVLSQKSLGGGREKGRSLQSEINCQDIGLKKETIEIIKEGMEKACGPEGTSHRFLDFDFKVGCKTGTAEFGPSTSSGESKTHAWFTIFAPLKNPRISITVLVEAGGGGSEVAAPIAREILKTWAEGNSF